jgi:hypothetical protein
VRGGRGAISGAGKNERSDLSAEEARAIAKALKAFEAELRRQFEERS